VLIDRAFGSTQGTVLNRGASVWAAVATPSLGRNGGTGGAVTLNGATSGSATIGVKAVAGTSIVFNLPTTNGSLNNVLITDGAGNTSWVSAGGGTVSSVGLALPGIFTVTNSPVTSTGTLTATLNTQTANTVWSGPASGASATPTFRSLVGADLPNPSSSSLGGVQSAAAVVHQWVNSISTSGVPVLSQPAFADISGSIAPAQCPNPTASTTGCIQSYAAVASQWINAISTGGVPSSSQPTFSDVAGQASLPQLPSIGGTTILSNITGGTATPAANSLTSIIDAIIGSAQGSIIYRSGTVWTALSPGTSGQVLTTSGPAANPSWTAVTGTGTVTSVATNAGLTGGPITTSGTIGLAPISTGNVLANVSGGSAAPSATTPTQVLDVIGSTQGNILYRSGTVWSALAPGTNGQFLMTPGAGSTPSWASIPITAAWTNTRLAKTSAYTAASADCTDTIVASGGFFAVTFNAPSGYTTNCAVLVKNNDATTTKLVIPQFASSATSITIGTGSKSFTTSAGLTVSTTQRYRVYSLANPANFMAGLASYSGTTFTLTSDTVGGSGTFTDWQIAPEIRIWPSQQRWIYNQNNVWLLDPRTRWLTPGLGNVYELCVRQDGSDSNGGFGSASTDCLANIQTAINLIGTEWDGGGYNSCAIGLYAGGTSIFNLGPGLSATGQSVGCYLTFNIRGTVQLLATGSVMNDGDNGISIWNWNLGFSPTFAGNTSNTASTGQFKLHQIGVYDFNGGTAVWIPGGLQGLGTGGTKGTNDRFIDVDLQGSLTFNAQVNVGNGVDTFNPNTFLACEAHCSKATLSGTVASSANVTFAVALALQAGSVINTNLTWPGTTATNPTTPVGYSVLIFNGTTIPGGTLPSTGFPAQNTNFGLVCSSPC
jgi:hypothetical protein